MIAAFTDQDWLCAAAVVGVAVLFWGFIYRTPRL